MDSVTYGIIIGIVFFTGIFVFTYFETPRRTLDRGIKTIDKGIDKGIKTLDKGIKKLRSVQVFTIKRTPKTPLTLPGSKLAQTAKKGDSGDMNVYVHEY